MPFQRLRTLLTSLLVQALTEVYTVLVVVVVPFAYVEVFSVPALSTFATDVFPRKTNDQFKQKERYV